MGIRRSKAAYVATVLLAGLGSVGATFVYPDNELVLLTAGHAMLAVLTFPLGFVASFISFVPVYMGLATLAETTFVMTPIFALLGYIQWCRLVPALYRDR
ncbi:MAG: hypothetical protein JWM58_2694 [Rhizobium sp.]|jgi:hypothetical protein|nr:hypothetical protein [Rhizobium sp.]